MDKKPTIDVKVEIYEFVTETDSENEENDDIQIRSINEENDGKFLFIYQYNDVKKRYRKYAPYLLLLNSTYKTTKYVLVLSFLVAKTNVNYQVRSYSRLISINVLF